MLDGDFAVELYRDETVDVHGIGTVTFFDDPHPQGLTEDMIEKWWCLGDTRNRSGIWVQGRYVSERIAATAQ